MSNCKHDFDYDGYCARCRRGGEEIIAELEAKLELAQKDAAFYRCCALSGEVPTDGSEPSAQESEK